jgi:hypothetical protein
MEKLKAILLETGHILVTIFHNADKIAALFTTAALIAGLWWFYKRREKVKLKTFLLLIKWAFWAAGHFLLVSALSLVQCKQCYLNL